MLEIIKDYIVMSLLMFGVLIFGKIAFDKKTTLDSKRKIIFFEIICILQGITLFSMDETLKTIIMLIYNTIFFMYIFQINFLKSSFAAFICMLIYAIPDMIELFVLTSIFGMEKEYCYNVFAGSIISNIIVLILYIIIIILMKKPLRKLFNTEVSDNFKIIVLSFFTLISISLFFYSIVKKFEFSNDIIQYFVAILVLVAILFSLIRQTIENNKKTKEYDKLLEFMTTFENEIEKQRILRHEAKNEFLTIRAKIYDNQKNKEIIEYIDEILKDKIKVKQEEYAKFGYLPPNGIKGLCYFKVQEAEEKGIKVSLNISKKIKQSTIYELDTKQQREFGRIMGVLLDNAIEASTISKEKQLGIEAYTTRENEFKMIISNTYNNKIDNNKIGKERFSTKGKTRGHGLLLVKHIINKNKIFGLISKIENNIYTQTIIIKKV